jgi:hypothetical protein
VSSRNHEVLRVYLGDREFGSILIIGKLVAVLQNGNTIDTEFIAQINLEGVTEGRPKGKLYKVWGVSWHLDSLIFSEVG